MTDEAPADPRLRSQSPRGWMRDVSIVLITASVALIAAHIGADATVRSTDHQIQASAHDATRAKRAEVYSKYLTAANQFSVESDALIHGVFPKASKNGVPSFSLTPGQTRPFFTARSAYQDAINQLYVYGSDRAWRLHQLVAATLPPSLTEYSIKAVNSDAFLAAYRGFQAMFCEEVPAEPRLDC